MSGKYKPWLLLVIAGAVVAAVILFYLRQQPPQLTATLSDGTVLRLERVTYGRRHTAGVLPDLNEIKSMWAARSWSRHAFETENETLAVWIVKEGGSAMGRIRIGDHRLKNTAPFGVPGGLAVLPIKGFTRTGTHVFLDVEEFSPAGKGTVITTWRIPNPARREPTQFKPRPIPITQKIDGISVRLRRAETEWNNETTTSLVFRFDMFRSDFPANFLPAYEPVRAELFDGTGNAVRGRGIPSGDITFYSAELDRGAPAWKLRTAWVSRDSTKTNILWKLQIPGLTSPAATFENVFSKTKVTFTGPTTTRFGPGYLINLSKAEYHVSIMEIADSNGTASNRVPQPDPITPTEYVMLAGPWWPAFSTSSVIRVTLAVQPTKTLEFDFTPPDDAARRR